MNSTLQESVKSCGDMFPDGAQFGGAPANFVCHSQALGARSHMVSCVGNDELGRRALGFLKEHGVDISAVTQSEERGDRHG